MSSNLDPRDQASGPKTWPTPTPVLAMETDPWISPFTNSNLTVLVEKISYQNDYGKSSFLEYFARLGSYKVTL